MPLRHWLQLALTEGIGPILIGRLVSAAGGAEAACAADSALLRGIEGIGISKSRNILESLRRAAGEADAEIERCRATNVSIISRDDPAYPEMLQVIPDPPPILFIRGSLQPRDLNALGIVGSRRCSHYGREQSERFAALLAQAGLTLISGGARGVDSAAHRGALAPAGGRTIAVLGCGVDIAYPPENSSLFEQIVARGAVISEFPLGSPPMKENFPRRNRIISGMSRGVLVIEADVKSGALITARQAGEEHGRTVFALPGRVDNAMSAGPHALIRDGATLVTNLEDILEGLSPLPHSIMSGNDEKNISPDSTDPASEMPNAASENDQSQPALFKPPVAKFTRTVTLTTRQQIIIEQIGEDHTNLDIIIARSQLPAEIVLQELTMLTLRGVVKRVDGQTYKKK